MTQPILLVSNHADMVGGGEASLLALLRGLDRACWRPTLLVPGEGPVAARARALGVPVRVVPLPSLRRPGASSVRSLRALRRLITETDARLVHANGSRAMAYAGLAARLTGRPAIWHVRILESDPWLDWLLARLATRTIAISEAVRDRLRGWGSAYARCAVVPNGLDLDGFRPSETPASVRRRLGVTPGASLVGTVGRLVAFKGQRVLLEAFARLLGSHPSVELVIVGDGPDRGALEARARELGVAAAVRFTGHREDVADLVAAVDVFVLPSVAEPSGRVLLEAMALERPIVATAAGGVPEVVVDGVTGLLVRPADPDALAKAVAALLDDPGRARALARAGRRRVEEHYSLARHAERVGAIYRAVLETGPR
ncbi:MAG: glycosyltransferase [Candidatus Rokubacteria bacterium]|nr:glycosyltransferase [Candidatus Rokubacteria bacterium]